MGFEFSSADIIIEIEGQAYTVTYGDPDLQDRVAAFTVELTKTLTTGVDEGIYSWISAEVHQFIAEIMGADAEAAIFEGRGRNVIDELRLFLYIQHEINVSAQMKELEQMLGRFSVNATV